MADIRDLEEFLNRLTDRLDSDVLWQMEDFEMDSEDIIVDNLADSRIYRKQIEQITIDLQERLIAKVTNTKGNLDDPGSISDNVDRIYDLMTGLRSEIDELLNSLNKEFEAGKFADQGEAEDMLNDLKGIRKNFNEIFEDFEDAYYNDELTMDM